MDKYWSEIQNVVSTLSGVGQIVGPVGFQFPGKAFHTYSDLHILDSPEIVIIHKGQVGINVNFETLHKSLSNLKPFFENEVFVLFCDKKFAFAEINYTLSILREKKIIADVLFRANKYMDAGQYTKAAICFEELSALDNNYKFNFLYSLFAAGEFNMCNEEINKLKEVGGADFIVAEFYYATKDFQKLLELIPSRNEIGNSVTWKIYQIACYIDCGDQNDKLAKLVDSIDFDSLHHDSDELFKLIDLSNYSNFLWEKLLKSAKLKNYINSNYFLHQRIDDEFSEKLLSESSDERYDAVITWLGVGNMEWRMTRKRYAKDYLINEENSGKNRLYQANEIYLCLNLLSKNAINLNKIYIVTPTRDDRLDTELLTMHLVDKIVYVYQGDLSAEIAEPSFNSDAIESQIFRIPGLSENFLYLNDDYFLLRPINFGTLFKQDFFLADHFLQKRSSIVTEREVFCRDSNTAKEFFQRFNYIPNFIPSHQIYLCKVSLFRIANDFFRDLFQLRLYQSRFRTHDSPRFLSLLFWFGASQQIIRPLIVGPKFQKNLIGLTESQLSAISGSTLFFLCVNNINADNSDVFEHLAARLQWSDVSR